jgi:acyl-CoA-binding protein
MVAAQSDAFKKAIDDSKKLSKTPSNDELLEVRPTDPRLR